MTDIRTDEDLAAVIDDICHYMKGGQPYSPFRDAFRNMLAEFIREHRLDTDPHAFASLPEGGPK